MTELVTMVIYMSDGSQHPVDIPRDQVESLLADAAKTMRESGQLYLTGTTMLFNGAHIVAVVPRGMST